MTKIKLLSAFGLNEHAPKRSIFIVLLSLMGIGMTADWIAGDDRQWLGILFLFISFGVYWWTNYRSRNLKFKQEHINGEKRFLIAIIPSRLDLYHTITQSHPGLQKIYFIYDNFTNDKIIEVKNTIKHDKRCSQDTFLHVASTQNPKNIISSFDSILEHLKNVDGKHDEILIEVTTGQTLSSLTLYHLGSLYNIDVSCLVSNYDEHNNVIHGSSLQHKIDFTL